MESNTSRDDNNVPLVITISAHEVVRDHIEAMIPDVCACSQSFMNMNDNANSEIRKLIIIWILPCPIISTPYIL